MFGTQGITWGDSVDAWTTPSHYHIDLPRTYWARPYLSTPNSHGAAGRTGPSPSPAVLFDVPFRPDKVYPDSVSTIVLDLELAAFCAAGAGQGQYLGTCTWRWERAKGSSSQMGTATLLGTSLAPPSAAFLEAVERFVSRTKSKTGFEAPPVNPPQKGGVACSQ